ncbi:MAG: OmpA family protein [Candidatus Babeliaceae bacterium]
MKKFSISILSLIVFVTGCIRKAQHQPETYTVPEETQTEMVAPDKKTKKLFIDEGDDLDTFVLEDDQAFDYMPGTPILHLMDEPKSGQWMDQHDQQKNAQELTTIYFDFDSTDLRPDQMSQLDEDAEKIKELTDAGKQVIIEGHACKFAGSATYNMMLSERRAIIAKDYLVKKGIPSESLKAVGRGFEMCVVPQGSMEEQSPNRRVEFYVNK